MKKRILFLVIGVVVLSTGQAFGVIQKISKMSVSDIYSADASGSWMAVSGSSDATINFQFPDEDIISVDLSSGYYSLSNIADAINLVSQNLGNDVNGVNLCYQAAYIIDSVVTPGQYSLMLLSRTESATPMEIFTTTSAGSVLTGNFGPAGYDLTGDNMYFFAAIPEPATCTLLGLGMFALIQKHRKVNHQKKF